MELITVPVVGQLEEVHVGSMTFLLLCHVHVSTFVLRIVYFLCDLLTVVELFS
jgi:hypothetical protein